MDLRFRQLNQPAIATFFGPRDASGVVISMALVPIASGRSRVVISLRPITAVSRREHKPHNATAGLDRLGECRGRVGSRAVDRGSQRAASPACTQYGARQSPPALGRDRRRFATGTPAPALRFRAMPARHGARLSASGRVSDAPNPHRNGPTLFRPAWAWRQP